MDTKLYQVYVLNACQSRSFVLVQNAASHAHVIRSLSDDRNANHLSYLSDVCTPTLQKLELEEEQAMPSYNQPRIQHILYWYNLNSLHSTPSTSVM